jgi:hypothetical protein
MTRIDAIDLGVDLFNSWRFVPCTIARARPSNLWLGVLVIGLCTIFAARSTPAISGEPQTGVTLEDYLGCWTSIEPAGLTTETDYNKPDGYIVLIESMMLSIERVNSKPEFRDLVKGAFDIWSDNAGTLIPTQYYNGVFDPVLRSVTQGAPGQGNSTLHLEGDQLAYVHHKATEKSSDMSVRYLKRFDCKEMSARRAKLQATHQR